jgi:hypothetical protein
VSCCRQSGSEARHTAAADDYIIFPSILQFSCGGDDISIGKDFITHKIFSFLIEVISKKFEMISYFSTMFMA